MNSRAAAIVLLLTVGAVLLVSGVLWQLRAPESAASSDARVVADPSGDADARGRGAGDADAGGADGAPVRHRAMRILTDWDERRAEAWAAGSVADLRGLYTPGSSTAAADVALLRRYLARGLTVRGMRMQVLAFRVAHRSPRRLVLVVTDRLTGAVAVGEEMRSVLPTDEADRRRVTLVRRHGTWLVREARPA